MSPRRAFALIVALFFTWGFLTALNDVLVADFRGVFHLSYRSATLVQLCFYSTCFFASFPSSRLVARFGFRNTMAVGLGVMCLAALCFVGAASVAVFGVFLGALVVMAAGSTALQTAAGPYVCLIGEEGSAAARFSLALGVNSLGAMLGPALGSVMLRDTGSTGALRLPYLGIAAGLMVLVAVVMRSRLPAIGGTASDGGSYRDLLAHPRLLFGVLAMVLYVGAEIGIGSLLINFLGLPQTLAMQPERAALLASLYGAGAMTGRFVGRVVLDRVKPVRALVLVAAVAIGLMILAVMGHGAVAAYALVAVGLANAVMVPVLFTNAISGLGALTAKGSGLLVAALVGGALIPFAQGALADRVGLQRSFVLPLICYGAVLGYGLLDRRLAPRLA